GGRQPTGAAPGRERSPAPVGVSPLVPHRAGSAVLHRWASAHWCRTGPGAQSCTSGLTPTVRRLRERGSAMTSPGYTTKDLVYYTGLFAGIILVYLGLGPLGVHPILSLLLGLGVGVGLGWLLERLYTGSSSAKPRDPNDYPE